EDGEVIFDSGLVSSDDMFCIYKGREFQSGEIITWCVTLWDESGKSEKSENAVFEIGLLHSGDWKAKWICGINTDKEERLPADYYKKSFSVNSSIIKARLYATACGVYEARINGKRVEGYVLAPGCTEYEKRLYYQTYDVTDMIDSENNIEFIVGDGWFKGKIGSDSEEYFFGRQTKLLAQLEIFYSDGRKDIIATDHSFLWCNDGPIGYNDLKDGIEYDASKMPSYSCYAVETTYEVAPTATNSPAIKEHETFTPKLLQSPSGKNTLDFGQNLAGYIRFKVKGKRGNKLTIRMCEILENGEYCDKTFKTLPKRGKSINQQIDYILSGNNDTFEPNFFYSGFRYALVEGMEEVNPENFEAVAVYSSMEYVGDFKCSNGMINKFVENTIWSEKSNFVDIPTDCPQREKSGWTGDAQLFAKTATYFADTSAFFRKWLKDVRDCQREDGRVDNVCPKIRPVNQRDMLNGSVGWADAAIIIPYTLWKMYNDDSFIMDNYELMHGWKQYVMKASADKTIYHLSDGHPMKSMKHVIEKYLLPDSPYNKYIIESGLHWGEWAEPLDVFDCSDPMFLVAPKQEEAAAYMHYSMSMLAEMLRYIGKGDEAAVCEEYAIGAKKAYNFHFVKEDDIVTDRQAKLVRPLAFGLLDETAQKNVAKRLNDVAISREYKVGTGFLSTPFVLQMLVKYGYVDTAYKMLENTDEPGWLAMVANGATTVWECYNNFDKDGHCLGHSMNHYSPGAVCGFLFEKTCGINVDGKNKFTISPNPGGTLTFAKARYNSVYGEVVSSWTKEDGKYIFNIEVPSNTKATIILPDGQRYEVEAGKYQYYCTAFIDQLLQSN
ncbi:family 78 glycoside hydrolase catalytic domain, partial [Neobacillus niacini]|uniref:family 78 glycoside hydrolase catalytic domain n=1 Tax=Neobacillus niacini TaxID=86668 RepID=UPI002FFD66AE